MEDHDLPPLPTTRIQPFDPPPEYKRFRAEAPAVRVRTPRGTPAWLITRLQDIRSVLTDKRFSSDPRQPGYPSYLTGDVPPPPGFFMQMDAPDHTRLRSLVSREFLVKHVETMRPQMQHIVDTWIDSLLAQTPPVDLVKAFALPVASTIICELLGVAYDDHTFFQSRTDAILSRSSTAAQSEAAAIELMTYFDRVITEKEKAPGTDLLGRLLSDPARQVSHQEFVGLAALLLLAGYDTMAQVIGLGTVTLLLHPDQLAELLDKPESAVNMVEELVRYLTVNHAGLPRVALADVEVGGQLIRAGEGVLVMLNAGNRDDTAFANPDAFDIHRDAHHHVGFGHGLHKCIGAPFARAELEIVFRTLFRRIPTLHLIKPVEELPFRHEMVLYGLHALPIGW